MENNTKQRIIEFAKDYYKTLDFAHNIGHGERVVKIALYIMKQEGGDPDLVETGAWLHQFHDNINELKQFLNTLNINIEEKERLIEIVSFCRPEKITTQSSIEARIVFDADAIEVLGTYGTIRELFCNIKARNKYWDVSVIDTLAVQKNFLPKLMTPTAKKIIKKSIILVNHFWNDYFLWKNLDILT